MESIIKSSVIEIESQQKELESTNVKNEELLSKIDFLEAELQQESNVNKENIGNLEIQL